MSSMLTPLLFLQCLLRCPTHTRILGYIFGINKYVFQLHTQLKLKPGSQVSRLHSILP